MRPSTPSLIRDSLPLPVQSAIQLLKAQLHEPFPLIVMDRGYNVLDANAGASVMLASLLPSDENHEPEGRNLARFTSTRTVAVR